MNPILAQIVIDAVLRDKEKNRKRPRSKPYSRFELVKGFRELRIVLLQSVKDVGFITFGIFSAAFGLKSFLLPNNFIDGGVTGISLLVAEITDWPLPVLLLVINLPFMLLAFRVVDVVFAVKTAISVVGLSIILASISFPEVTHDKLLGAVFGGFFLGAGIGLSIRGGSVLDGTEVMAIHLSRRLRTTVGDFIIIFNVLIFSVASYLLSVEIALYSMITYLAASKTLDFVIEGIEEYTGVTIISVHYEEIRQVLINDLGRGVTVYKGQSGYGKRGSTRDIDIIYTVITRLEISRLHAEVDKIDPDAFIVTSSVKDIRGGMIKKRPLKD